MTPDEYQDEAMRTADVVAYWEGLDNSCPVITEDLLHAVMGLSTEVGEITDNVKRHFFYGKELDQANLVEECGDVLWYIVLLLDTLNVSLSDCMTKNIAKLKVRYPEKFSEERALVRDLDAERKAIE